MNQTKKRLQIINIAISITDIETIQLQMLKLASLRSDPKLKEILSGLQAQNYAQTQALIKTYIETPTEEIIQRTPQDDQEVIEEFDLFLTTPETPAEEETELFDFDTFAKETPSTDRQLKETVREKAIDFDNLLNLTAEDIMPDNINLDIRQTREPEDDFFNIQEEEATLNIDHPSNTDAIPRDDFFDIPETVEEKRSKEEIPHVLKTDSNREEIAATEERAPAETTPSDQETLKRGTVAQKETERPQTPPKTSESHYRKIPYIDQKLKNMLTQYPPLVEAQNHYDTVNHWLLKISQEGYTEEEIEEIISSIEKLKKRNEIAEAAQLLLICGATQSKYAQFILARELFKGEILEKNLPEAFTLINRLAMDDDYPEAICDLAQLYENGIGIDKDKHKAEALYKESMDLGVKRAKAHYERLHNANKGLFGKFFGK
jgi:hypothetical protein